MDKVKEGLLKSLGLIKSSTPWRPENQDTMGFTKVHVVMEYSKQS